MNEQYNKSTFKVHLRGKEERKREKGEKKGRNGERRNESGREEMKQGKGERDWERETKCSQFASSLHKCLQCSWVG